MGLVLSMSGITIALFFVTKQIAVLLTGGALLLCALVHFAYNMVITHLLKSGFITRVSAGRKSA